MKLRALKVLAVALLVPMFAHALCVNADNVSLRDKPDGKGKVTWVVGRNMPFLEMQRKGAYYQVSDVDGETHWVHARYVTNKINCAVVRAKIANLRTGPSSDNESTDLGTATKYLAFKKLGRDEEWLKVQDAFGFTHWAHEKTLWEARGYARVNF